MSETIEDQIRRGLRLLADDVQPLTESRTPNPRVQRAVVAVALVGLIGAVVVAVAERGGREAGPRFLPDAFNYRIAKLAYQPGGVVGPIGGPLRSVYVAGLTDMSAASAGDVWIVGSDTASPTRQQGLAWHWNGTAWRAVATLAVRDNVELDSVATVADGEAWAVGMRSSSVDDQIVQALVEHWDGSRWDVVRLPRTGVSRLFSVSASGPDNVWAVGESFRRDARGRFSESLARPLLLHWDGSTWRAVAVPFDGSRVVTTGPNDVWLWALAGEQITHWDGARWRAIPAPFGPHDPVWGFSATSADDAWAVGSYRHGRHSRTLAAHWDGHEWRIAPTPNPGTDAALTNVVAVGPDDAWAIGQSERLTFLANGGVSGRGPYTLVEHWDGRRWQVASGATPSIWNRVPLLAATEDGTAWAVGSCAIDNVILRWNGSGWTIVRHPPDQHWAVPPSDRRGRSLGHHCRALRS